MPKTYVELMMAATVAMMTAIATVTVETVIVEVAIVNMFQAS